jgi:hypothetical protein
VVAGGGLRSVGRLIPNQERVLYPAHRPSLHIGPGFANFPGPSSRLSLLLASGQDRGEPGLHHPPPLSGEQRRGVQLFANVPELEVLALAGLGAIAVANQVVIPTVAARNAVDALRELLDLVATFLKESWGYRALRG